MEKQEIIFYRESLIQSILADVFSYGILVGSVAFNHLLIGSKFLNAVLLVMFIMFITARVSAKKKTFTNKEDLQKYIDNL
jgi:hypothetical protein